MRSTRSGQWRRAAEWRDREEAAMKIQHAARTSFARRAELAAEGVAHQLSVPTATEPQLQLIHFPQVWQAWPF